MATWKGNNVFGWDDKLGEPPPLTDEQNCRWVKMGPGWWAWVCRRTGSGASPTGGGCGCSDCKCNGGKSVYETDTFQHCVGTPPPCPPGYEPFCEKQAPGVYIWTCREIRNPTQIERDMRGYCQPPAPGCPPGMEAYCASEEPGNWSWQCRTQVAGIINPYDSGQVSEYDLAEKACRYGWIWDEGSGTWVCRGSSSSSANEGCRSDQSPCYINGMGWRCCDYHSAPGGSSNEQDNRACREHQYNCLYHGNWHCCEIYPGGGGGGTTGIKSIYETDLRVQCRGAGPACPPGYRKYCGWNGSEFEWYCSPAGQGQ